MRQDLEDCHALHARVMSGFGEVDPDDSARQAHGVLFEVVRVGGGRVLLVQSRTRPDWSKIPRGYLRSGEGAVGVEVAGLAGVLAALRPAQVLPFRLCTNPCRKVKGRAAEAGRSSGQRVPITGAAARAEWLARKGREAGFELVNPERLVQIEHGTLSASRPAAPDEPPITVSPVTFAGELRVVDPAALVQAVQLGIGPSKAYGCGLLALAAYGGAFGVQLAACAG